MGEKRLRKHAIFVDDKVHVRAKRCDTCIFGRNSPVTVERREEMIEVCAQKEGVIPCHHHLGEKINPVCHGFYELRQNFILRLAESMEVIKWI
jgi:hypothetical protein